MARSAPRVYPLSVRIHALIAVTFLSLLPACGPSPQIHATGTIAARSEFTFGNFVVVVVDAPSATYEWSQYHVRDGSAFNVPYAELRVQLAHGEVLISDQGATNGQVFVAGAPIAGTRFRLNADGTIDQLAR